MRELGTARAQRARVDILEEYGRVEEREFRMILVRSRLRGLNGIKAITSAGARSN